MLVIKNKTKHCNRKADNCNGLISRLDIAKERISQHDDLLIETSQTEIQRGKK
jgi:hypothetical protein